jgi:hypothetical protein
VDLTRIIVWLAIAGPVTALVLAHQTGGLTWSRVLLWTAGIQLVLSIVYFATQSMPVRTYGNYSPTRLDHVVATAQFAATVIVIGLIVTAIMTPLARWLARG